MAKIRIAQVQDLGILDSNGVKSIQIGTPITPLTSVAPLTGTGFVSGFAVSGNTIVPSFTEVDFAGYATETFVGNAISTALADYSTTTQMNSAISSAISTALADYSTTEQMNSAISAALANYYTKAEIDATLGNYVTATSLATTLNDYVLKSSINAGTLATTSTTTIPSEKTVADYVTAQLSTLDTTAYTAGNGIDITNHKVSAVVKTGDNVLSVDDNGLQTTIGIAYDETKKEIKLVGIGGAQIGNAIDATDFIKDGMLKSVTLDGTDLVLTWNTDGDPNDDGTTGDVVRVPLGSLVDVYTADETYIKLGANNKFSHVEKDVDTASTYGGKSADFSNASLVFSLPKFTVDKAGHVNTISNDVVTIPTTTTIADGSGAGLATEGAVKTYVDNAFTAQATKHVHQESTTTTISLGSTPVSIENSNFDVYQNGIRLNESEFAVSGTTLTITPEVAHVAGDKYLVCYVAKA